MAGFGRVVLCGKYILVIFEEESKQPGSAQHKGMQRKGMPHNGMQCRANLLREGEGKGAGNKRMLETKGCWKQICHML